MCEFIETEHVAPGVGCCKCKAYNGLQRFQCRECGQLLHRTNIPANIRCCKNCGFGFPSTLDLNKPWQSLEDKLDGEKPSFACPVCAAPQGPLLN